MVRLSVAAIDMCELRGGLKLELGHGEVLEAVACQGGKGTLNTRLAPIARESLQPARWCGPKSLHIRKSRPRSYTLPAHKRRRIGRPEGLHDPISSPSTRATSAYTFSHE
jgi:hypothetical protein